MGTIYQQTTQVVVWLGVGDETTARAIRMLKWVFPAYKLALQIPFLMYTALAAFNGIRYHFQDTLLRDDQNAYLEDYTTDKQSFQTSIEGMRRLVHHNWFRRIWTLQEISLA